YSVEAWGGATYDVAMRFLFEDPWQRLDLLREAMPNVNIQMLLRGRNTVGYTPYPDSVCRAFVQEAAKSGVDVFRIFDALNDVSQMRPAIEAVLETNTTVAEVAMAYSGNLSDPNEKLYTLDYYLNLAEEIVKSGAHVLAIKDMAGLLRPDAAATLVTELRKNFDLPVHVHTHDTAGGQLATRSEVAMAYSGNLSDPNEKLYTLDYYLNLAEEIVKSGAHVLAIKDMAGLLRPDAAATLVTELRKNFDLPVHVHTHDTAGGQLAT